jgi:hypothetical protein
MGYLYGRKPSYAMSPELAKQRAELVAALKANEELRKQQHVQLSYRLGKRPRPGMVYEMLPPKLKTQKLAFERARDLYLAESREIERAMLTRAMKGWEGDKKPEPTVDNAIEAL